MSYLLRRISLSRLLLLCATAIAVGAGATAAAVALGGGPTPPPKPLANAIHDALATPPVQGVSARVELVNHLIDSTALQTQGAGGGGASTSPLLSGASGRLWIAADGHARLELQSEGGATELMWDGSTVTLYDASKDRLYSYTPPAREAPRGEGSGSSGGEGSADSGEGSGSSSGEGGASHQVPSVAKIEEAISRLMGHANVSGATPTDVAGRPAYSVRISPQRNGGLVGGAELAWDAVHGVPLQVAIYAKGDPSPVLELTATEISYGPVSRSVFELNLPPGVKRTEIKPPQREETSSTGTPSTETGAAGGGHHPGAAAGGHHPRVSAKTTGLAAVSSAVPFKLSAPEELAGMQRGEVRLVEANGHEAALVTYGEGLGGIVVIESKAKQGEGESGEGESSEGSSSLQLPTVTIDGAKATELPTALGTILSFTSEGVQHILAGSVTPSVLETAAKGL